ncbi:hypothetical protein BMS3Bbin16_00688 [archaeon BMS3Bbin16]|nr:hypothetical protein BMS3Bbin16_00688 [archaeon BMS3Bbin16]
MSSTLSDPRTVSRSETTTALGLFRAARLPFTEKPPVETLVSEYPKDSKIVVPESRNNNTPTNRKAR